MPFYYDISVGQTSNATVNTENQAARLLTIANQTPASVMGLYMACRMASAGGAEMRLKTAATAGTAGTGVTPAKRHPNAPAASTTAFTAHTAGGTLTTRLVIGAAATGGLGGWVALNDDHGFTLLPNAGANGNCELTNISALASTLIEWTLEFLEE